MAKDEIAEGRLVPAGRAAPAGPSGPAMSARGPRRRSGPVLLGRHRLKTGGFRLALQARQVRGAERMVVGKGMGPHDRRAASAQRLEELLRPSDSRKGQDLLAAQGVGDGRIRRQARGKDPLPLPFRLAMQQPPRPRRARSPGLHGQPPIAPTEARAEDRRAAAGRCQFRRPVDHRDGAVLPGEGF